MTHYETLQVPSTASDEAVRAAYTRLVFELHPDRGGDPARFRAVKEAYAVLRDPAARARYDQLLRDRLEVVARTSAPSSGTTVSRAGRISADEAARVAEQLLGAAPPGLQDLAGPLFRAGLWLKRRREGR